MKAAKEVKLKVAGRKKYTGLIVYLVSAFVVVALVALLAFATKWALVWRLDHLLVALLHSLRRVHRLAGLTGKA